jgi:hypothetical protein
MFEQEWNKLSYDPSDKKHNMDRTRERLQNFIELHAEGVCPYDIVKFPFATPEGADVISDNEVPFAIDIGANLPFLGRIDLPARCRQTNDLWANDYKTASEISSRLWECFELNIQAIGYTIALSQLSGEKCTGFMVEAIRKSATKNKTECAIHYEYIDDYRIELFLDYMSNLVLKLQNYQYNKEWPKRLSSCSTYSTTGIPGGHCPYKLLCRAEDWRSEAKYYKRKKPFHPFSIKPEGVKE